MAKILTCFFTNNGVPQSGLTPTINIYELNPLVPTSNTLVVSGGVVSEIGGGWYRYTFAGYNRDKSYVFTFDGGAVLSPTDRYKYGGNESYLEEIAPAVWDQTLTDHTSVGSTGLALAQIQADVASVLISEVAMTTLLNTLVKYERNRTKIDINAATLTIYDNDGTTPLTVFDLKDFSGMPSIQEVCERVPR